MSAALSQMHLLVTTAASVLFLFPSVSAAQAISFSSGCDAAPPPCEITLQPGGAGGSPVTAPLTVSNAGGNANYTASANQPWLKIAPSSGPIAGGGGTVDLTISADPSLLDPSDFQTPYQGTITVSAAGENITATVFFPVQGTKISVSTQPSTTFTIGPGQSSTARLGVTVFNSPSTQQGIAIDVDAMAPWLTIDKTVDTTPATLTVTANTVGLSGSSYSGTLIIKCDGGSPCVSIRVTFTLNIQHPITPAHLTASSLSVSLPGKPGGQLVSSAPLLISSSDATTAIAFTISSSEPAWLSAVASNNDTTPAYVTITADPRQLPASPNPYLGTISLTSTNALAPVTIQVTFTVSTINSGSALRFVPVTPCRLVDTRNANGAFGGPVISGQTSRDFIIPAGSCGILSNAEAYSLNVAVVPREGLGYLTVWPTGEARPLVATLNSLDGRIKSNATIVPAGAGGGISIFATNSTDVVLDINGYFVPDNNISALAFYPVTPCRVADTRLSVGPLGGPILSKGNRRTFPITLSPCNVPSSARAYSLNFAAVPKQTLGFLTAWPTGQVQPLVATLNATTGTVTANAAIVPVGLNGGIDVFVTDDSDLVIDINGYFAPPGQGGLSLYNLAPCRVIDTRQPAPNPPFGGERDVNVTSSGCAVAATAKSYIFNATVVPPGPLGFLTLWPQGTARPLVATLNAVDGAITANMAIVPTSNGSISAFPSSPTHLVLDIFGYFAP